MADGDISANDKMAVSTVYFFLIFDTENACLFLLVSC